MVHQRAGRAWPAGYVFAPSTKSTPPHPLPNVRQGAFDAYAMGNYPYATSYISGDPDHPLPPWPMRAACNRMAGTRMKASTLIEVRVCAFGTLCHALANA